MAPERLSRDQFFDKLSVLDESGLKKALWTLYWRGAAAQRERIEALIDPQSATVPAWSAKPARPDAQLVLSEVTQLATLARSGAYLAGDRRVSPRERTRWRFTFRRLAEQSVEALRGEDVETAAAAVATLIDLACETKGYDYFRSEDPMEAARFVVSDAVGALWSRTREVQGATAFTTSATGQLLRWESEYGWTRFGFGWVSERESQLGSVLAKMLESPALWAQAARGYLAALDRVGGGGGGERFRGQSRSRQDRAGALSAWHLMLVDQLIGSDDEALLDWPDRT